MRPLLDALRRQMSPLLWSRGVSLHRAERVSLLDDTIPSEIELEVVPLTGGQSRQVVLYLTDDEWECDCGADACEHAAAAAIAYFQNLEGPAQKAAAPMAAQGAKAGQGAAAAAPAAASVGAPSLKKAPARAHVAYAFTRARQALSLARVAVCNGQQEPLGVAIKVRQKRPEGPPLVVQSSDMAIDAVLAGRRLPEVLPAPVLQRILRALVDSPHVTLDGRPIEVGEPRAECEAIISRRAGGELLLRVQPSRALKEHFHNGAGLLADGVLYGLVALFMSPRELGPLQAGRTFLPSELPTLLDDVLPTLSRQLPVVWQNLRPPARTPMPPRVRFVVSTRRQGGEAGSAPGSATLVVVAQLIYGTPAVAVVRQGELRLLGEVVPLRERAEEARLEAVLLRELSLRCGSRLEAAGDAGAALLARVRDFGLRFGADVDDPDGAQLDFRSRRPLQARLGPVAFTSGPQASSPSAQGLAGAAEDDELWFECVNELGGPPTRVMARQLLEAYERKESTLAMPDGGFAPLPLRFLQSHHDALAAFLAARDAARLERAGPGKAKLMPPWAQAQLGRLCEALAVVPPKGAMGAWAVLSSQEPEQAGEAAADLAAPVRAWLAGAPRIGQAPVRLVPPGITLRPYQAAGVAWLAARLNAGLGALLADDMGLGKTLQTLLACAKRTLVVVPTTLLANWQAEAQRFCPGRPVHIYHGPKRALPKLAADAIVLTSYGVLRVDKAALMAVSWDAMVLDEGQVIKNAESQAALAACEVGGSAAARVVCTGTPLENNLGELWSLLHFANPGLFGTQAAFCARFGDGAGSEALASLPAALRPVMLRRKKSAVASMLPPKVEVVLRCTLGEQERIAYDALALASRTDVAARLQAGGNMMEALEALLRLRQAACHPNLVPGAKPASSSAKLDVLLSALAPAVQNGHRALVFSQWTSLLDLVEPALKAADIDFVRLDGSTKNRGEVVATFKNAEGPPVMLISLKAGGVGLNLTAADHVFLLDPWWNPSTEDQAADRAHRIGQERKVLVHRLIAADTIDEQLLALQEKKRSLAGAALGDAAAVGEGTKALAEGNQSGPGRLNRSEMLALLGV